jgi:hypothetical protein
MFRFSKQYIQQKQFNNTLNTIQFKDRWNPKRFRPAGGADKRLKIFGKPSQKSFSTKRFV